jgi:hypothetical protein
MDETLSRLLAELDASGIEAREERGEVYLRPSPPKELLLQLAEHRSALADALWARAGRARQEAAIVRLAADRLAWINESKRLGLYRGRA